MAASISVCVVVIVVCWFGVQAVCCVGAGTVQGGIDHTINEYVQAAEGATGGSPAPLCCTPSWSTVWVPYGIFYSLWNFLFLENKIKQNKKIIN